MNKPSYDISSFSYTPYSQNREYCHIIGKSGICYPGVRIENISFPLTIPAAQSAICSCLANNDVPVSIIEKGAAKNASDFWIQKYGLQELNAVPREASLFDPLIRQVDNLMATLKKLCKSSITTESNFPVSALLKTSEGYIAGVNVEFPEWNFGLCAERLALSRAFASGYRELSGMHIYAPKSEYISPCGTCRQVLFEHMPDQMVELHHDEQSLSRHLVSHLLPNGLTTNSLKK